MSAKYYSFYIIEFFDDETREWIPAMWECGPFSSTRARPALYILSEVRDAWLRIEYEGTYRARLVKTSEYISSNWGKVLIPNDFDFLSMVE